PTADDKLQFEPVDIKKLTPEYMIQQSTIDAVNSATQSLTVTYTTIMKTSNEYKTLLSELITLSRETLEFNVSDTHWDMIVELRSKVQNKKEMLTVRENKINLYQYITTIKNRGCNPENREVSRWYRVERRLRGEIARCQLVKLDGKLESGEQSCPLRLGVGRVTQPAAYGSLLFRNSNTKKRSSPPGEKIERERVSCRDFSNSLRLLSPRRVDIGLAWNRENGKGRRQGENREPCRNEDAGYPARNGSNASEDREKRVADGHGSRGLKGRATETRDILSWVLSHLCCTTTLLRGVPVRLHGVQRGPIARTCWKLCARGCAWTKREERLGLLEWRKGTVLRGNIDSLS
ncbi:hypothetical protein WH47_03654, partial [Habropoda laboriosa]